MSFLSAVERSLCRSISQAAERGQRNWIRNEVSEKGHKVPANGVRVVIVDASRFARELMAQELGITLLISRGVRLLTASGDDLTASDDPTRKMMRQIAGAFAQIMRKPVWSPSCTTPASASAKRRGSAKGASRMAELRPDVVALAKRLPSCCRGICPGWMWLCPKPTTQMAARELQI